MLSDCVTLDQNRQSMQLFEKFPNVQYTDNDWGEIHIMQKSESDEDP